VHHGGTGWAISRPPFGEAYDMYHPPIFFDPGFVVNVIAGWLLTAAGAVMLLLAGVWLSVAGEWLDGAPKPAAFRGLSAIGLAVFLAGLLWQIVGYYRVGAVTW
jgi:MFS superfamily sulfate permease-like transporter